MFSRAEATQLPSIPPAPPANCTARLLPLTQTVSHPHKPPECFAILIENALTPAECRSLLEYATSRERWHQALVNEQLATGVRNSERLILDSPPLAAMLLERVRPFLESEEAGVRVIRTRGKSKPGMRVWDGMRSHWLGTNPWRLTRLNERLRYLKYGPGQYFRRESPPGPVTWLTLAAHCDGSYLTNDGRERSLLTFHAYLGENSEENVGGATRFFGNNDAVLADVEPVQGRVLIFQHQWLVHSGEEMERGIKYTMRTDIMYEEAPELMEEGAGEFEHYRS